VRERPAGRPSLLPLVELWISRSAAGDASEPPVLAAGPSRPVSLAGEDARRPRGPGDAPPGARRPIPGSESAADTDGVERVRFDRLEVATPSEFRPVNRIEWPAEPPLPPAGQSVLSTAWTARSAYSPVVGAICRKPMLPSSSTGPYVSPSSTQWKTSNPSTENDTSGPCLTTSIR